MLFRNCILGLILSVFLTSIAWGQSEPLDVIVVEGDVKFSRLIMEIKPTSKFLTHPKARKWLSLLEKNLCWSGVFKLYKPKNKKYCGVNSGTIFYQLELDIDKKGATPTLLVIVKDSRGKYMKVSGKPVGKLVLLRRNILNESDVIIAINQITEQLTNKPGILGSTIAFTFKQPGRLKTIARVNTHGQNIKSVSHTDYITLAPQWNFDGTRIAYTYLKRTGSSNVLLDDLNGNVTTLANFTGASSGGSWSRDGKKLIVSMSPKKDGNFDLFEVDLITQKRRQLTRNRRIDVAPDLSPDGKTLLFASDRAGGGATQIYTMDMATRVVNRLTFKGARNTDPVWSPDGRLIAFTRSSGGRDQIYVMNARGENVRSLTSRRYRSEQPAWSPDSRQIVFTSNRGKGKKLYTVFLDGKGLRRVTNTPPGFLEEAPTWTLREFK